MIGRDKSNFNLIFSSDIRDVANVDDELVYPIIKFMSRPIKNIEVSVECGQKLGFVDKKIIKYLLWKKLEFPRSEYMVPADMQKEDKYSTIRKYFKDYYKWSEYELNLNWNIILNLMSNKDFKIWMHNVFGLEKSEAKLVGFKHNMVVKKEEDSPRNKSLFDFS